jgi:ATP adenylyltransferase
VNEHAPFKWLHAPWRITYIRRNNRKGKRDACFFCEYARAPKKDRKNFVLVRNRTCFALMNLYPYNGGHLLVAPLAHKAGIGELTERERLDLFGLLEVSQKTLHKVMKPHGYNLGVNLGRMAGAGIPEHLHFHIVPRWSGDTNFMPVIHRTRVVPLSLRDLHGRLQKALPKRR